jgi:hypothetical protein
LDYASRRARNHSAATARLIMKIATGTLSAPPSRRPANAATCGANPGATIDDAPSGHDLGQEGERRHEQCRSDRRQDDRHGHVPRGIRAGLRLGLDRARVGGEADEQHEREDAEQDEGSDHRSVTAAHRDASGQISRNGQ